MDDDLSKFVRSHRNLHKAWRTIGGNARASSSPYMREEAQLFLANEQTAVRSMASKIVHESYKFSKSRGVAASKPGKPGKVRPMVISKLPDRIVQRCILDALTSKPAIAKRAFQPLSFGGVPKAAGAEVAGVEAAIRSLLGAIDKGASHAMVADIEGFFTKISKSACLKIIRKYTDDKPFLRLLETAIAIDLENSSALWRHKALFPYGDIGIGQGNCLSPFLGNIILSNFDERMNDGDCVCIRYIDDIIIAAPSGAAASSRMRRAARLLGELGMNFAPDKSSQVPIQVGDTFEYLGIEFSKGLMRPAKKARKSIEARVSEAAASSIAAMKAAKSADEFDEKMSLPKTLNRISGMAKGWTRHYYFCNDVKTIHDVDEKLYDVFSEYTHRAQKIASLKSADLGAVCLGYQGGRGIEFKPLIKL